MAAKAFMEVLNRDRRGSPAVAFSPRLRTSDRRSSFSRKSARMEWQAGAEPHHAGYRPPTSSEQTGSRLATTWFPQRSAWTSA